MKKEIQDKFLNLSKFYKNIDLHIGPTEREHNYLMKNYKYYEILFFQKKYALISDIWRFWKLSDKNFDGGIYIDSLSKINIEKFSQYISFYQKNQMVLIKENGHLIWNGIIASKEHEMFTKILYFYQKHWKIALKLTGPLILSIFTYQYCNARLNKREQVYFLNASDIDPYNNDSFFNYNGLSSWQKRNKNANKGRIYFHKNAIKFKKGKYKSFWWTFIRWTIKHYLIIFLYAKWK